MQFDNTTGIDTPEGVQLELTLAGLGSRLVASLADTVVKGVIVLLAAMLAGAIGASAIFVALVSVPILFFGYETFFETRWSGRTPGKRWNGLRVVMADGSPVTFTPVLVRNLLRVVDWLPAMFSLGALLVFTTKKNQRLGDLAAGTLVIRERKADEPVSRRSVPIAVPAGFDATAVTQEQLVLARSYLERKDSLDGIYQARLANQIADELRNVVLDPTGSMSNNQLIAAVVAVKTGIGLAT